MPFRRDVTMIAAGVLLVGVGIVVVALLMLDRYTTHDGLYVDYGALADDNLIEKGWIPGFVPQSAQSIHVTHDIIMSEQRIKFGFDPNDLPSILDSIDRVSKDSVRYPSRHTMWSSLWRLRWPSELLRDSKQQDQRRQYIFGVYEGHRAYVAIDAERSTAWYWRHGRRSLP